LLLYPILGLDLGAHAFMSANVSLDGTVSVELQPALRGVDRARRLAVVLSRRRPDCPETPAER
jgi:hypothetical protein